MRIQIFFIILTITNIKAFDICNEQKNCEDCIKKSGDCIWCAMDDVKDPCRSRNSDINNWCLNDRKDPISSHSIETNLNFSSDINHYIQIKPQKIKIDLRQGQRLNFDFSFKNAKDYPVDIYFLLDGSKSMAAVKHKTANESEKVYKQMKTMTDNVLLGMGTFVDKNALPFTLTKNSTLTYSFKNHLKLTDELEVFKKVVNDIPFGFNYDEQEGTLDALAQVIVCKDEIGWRNESRKIIIVQTSSPFHAAGDGKWAGIVKPNDGKCYTKNGIYTKELEMDYPSLGLINRLASNEQMTIIFAINKDMFNLYNAVTKVVSGSRTSLSSDTLETLRSIYDEITNNLKIMVNMNWDYQKYFEITFNPDCVSRNNMEECTIKQLEEKKITGSIELLKYIEDVKNLAIDIVIEGVKEKLSLDINIIQTCNCSSEVLSPKCSFQGTKRCGICECPNDRWGDKCQCSINNSTSINDKTMCKALNSTKVCSGHGSCYCGACICSNRYEGRYCECSKDSCPRDENGALCSERGECKCGRCKCNNGWTGDVCNCLKSISPCMEGDKVCNNRGTCSCGACQCPPLASWDARPEQTDLCVILPCETCHNSQCNILEPCALCSHEQKECPSCNDFNVTMVTNVTAEESWNVCPDVGVGVGCEMKFGYKYSADRYSMELIVQSQYDCRKSYYMYGGGVLVALLVIGITSLFIWKCVMDAKDKRDYKRFLEEVQNSNAACDNPIYSPATTTFSNPAFRKRSLY